MSKAALTAATEVANSDSVGEGYCGRGVWSVLNKIGYGKGTKSANGQDWSAVLKRAGWKPVYCASPQKAPLGSVLVYNSDLKVFGKNLVGTQGGKFGHVEIVATDRKGRRVYVSDSPRDKPGGTVPSNFTKVAWIPRQEQENTMPLLELAPLIPKIKFVEKIALIPEQEILTKNVASHTQAKKPTPKPKFRYDNVELRQLPEPKATPYTDIQIIEQYCKSKELVQYVPDTSKWFKSPTLRILEKLKTKNQYDTINFSNPYMFQPIQPRQ